MLADLVFIKDNLRVFVDDLKNRSIFITGGTGFFGRWIFEGLVAINESYQLNLHLTLLSRHPEKFQQLYPEIILGKKSFVEIIKGDVTTFAYPQKHYEYIIHGATDVNINFNDYDPTKMFNTIIDGTKRVLDFGQKTRASKILFISSGAIYGQQPADLLEIPEDYADDSKQDEKKQDESKQDGSKRERSTSMDSYTVGKRKEERYTLDYCRENNIDCTIARCFAFAGACLPLDKHLALGNFIRDGLLGRDIVVKGDGTSERSYLYAADLVIWLVTILLQGKPQGIYNVGSNQRKSILEIANQVASHFPNSKVNVTNKIDSSRPNVIQRYIPSVAKAQNELGLYVYTSFEEAVRKTVQWYQSSGPVGSKSILFD